MEGFTVAKRQERRDGPKPEEAAHQATILQCKLAMPGLLIWNRYGPDSRKEGDVSAEF
jgi:hypothetical protein